jgi:prophage antirepressor-like protein
MHKKVDDDYKGVAKMATLDGKLRDVMVLEEAGIYQLIFSSQLPSAKKFQKWIFEEVLPSIRKTGKYEIPSSRPKELKELRKYVNELEEKVETIKLERKAKSLEKQLNNLTNVDEINLLAKHLQKILTIAQNYPEGVTVRQIQRRINNSKSTDVKQWFTTLESMNKGKFVDNKFKIN